MVAIINKIHLINFKRFQDYTIIPNDKINILVGDNEAGKSSVLEAIDLVAGGNLKRLETIGLDKIFNVSAVKKFNAGERKYENLPKLIIELYLTGNFSFSMNGKNNTDCRECDGIRLVCEPNPDYRSEITAVLNSNPNYFPFDYYIKRYSTFMDEGYTGYKKKLRCVLIDSANMNSEYATNDFIRRMYTQYTEDNVKERAEHRSNYRQIRDLFKTKCLRDLNARLPEDKHYEFGLKNGPMSELESDLMIYEDEIGIDGKGTGKQIFIKTDFAIEKAGSNVDVILIEEPENHLSHVNLRKLVKRVSETLDGQLFITTHNSLISTRLELKNLLIMHQGDYGGPTALKNLPESTAQYFMKAPPAGIIEFALSNKVVLVEGPSEYMLMELFYQTVTCHAPEDDGVQIIDVRGLSFKRYLDIAIQTGCKVAVITDNDTNAEKNCIKKYEDYTRTENIGIFFETDNTKKTFEIVLYSDNVDLCKKLFGDDAQEYMLSNKTEAAYNLLSQEKNVNVPDYIKRAIEWISL